jgi:DNA mismatch repair protein MSH4
MHLHYPCLVLVPHTSLSEEDAENGYGVGSSTSLLVQCIMEEFAGVPIEPVQRKYWNDIAGDEHSALFFGCVQS